jgi:DNA-binding protein HU-beta
VNRQELVQKIAQQTGQTQTAVSEVLNSFASTVQDAVAAGDKVVLVGFGTFEVTDRAARTGRNPQTGEPLSIAASKSPKFSAGKAFKDAVNGK